MITGLTIAKVEGSIDSIEAVSKQRFPKLNINLEGIESKGEHIAIAYTFSADYFDSDAASAKSIGSIKIRGTVDVKDSKDVLTAVVKKWNDEKRLPTVLAEEVINALNFRCSATGTLVASSLGLIPPLVISTTRIQEEEKK